MLPLMRPPDPHMLLGRFLDAVEEVEIPVESKAEVVINLGKMWGLDDLLLRQELGRRLGPEAADHPYFHWEPRPRFFVGSTVRVVSGAPQALGRIGRVTAVEDPRRHGVRGMGKGFFYTVVLDGRAEEWGFREEQLEEHSRR